MFATTFGKGTAETMSEDTAGLLVRCSADMAGNSSFALVASRHLARRCFKNADPMTANEKPCYFSRKEKIVLPI